MKRQDIRMGEPSGDLDLAQEALGPDGGSKLGAQDLERHGPVMAKVVGEIDRRHSPAAEFALDRVTPGEGDLKAGQLVWHGCSGGQRIRTSKGLRPPVFKTGALPFGQPSRGKHRRLNVPRPGEAAARVLEKRVPCRPGP